MDTTNIKVIRGNLITIAQTTQELDVITHGCNCFCTMSAGIAPHMHKAFGCNDPDYYSYENKYYAGDIKKLGTIQSAGRPRQPFKLSEGTLIVVNCYTQYDYRYNESAPYGFPLDYDAMKLCFRKMGHIYKGKTIGLPGLIGAGLAGGDSDIIIDIIEKELSVCHVKIFFIEENKIPERLKKLKYL